jgi:hypothetical protein
VALSWDGGASWTAGKTDSSKPPFETTVLFGADGDTWGRTWTEAELGNATFRARVTYTANNKVFNLDWIPVQVYWR